MAAFTKLILILEFSIAIILGLFALVALMFFGSMALEEVELLLTAVILFVAAACTISAIRIVGYYAFNGSGQINKTWWQAAWLGFIVSSLSLAIVLFNEYLSLGLDGDKYIALPLLSFGVILALPFLHCLYLEHKRVSE